MRARFILEVVSFLSSIKFNIMGTLRKNKILNKFLNSYSYYSNYIHLFFESCLFGESFNRNFFLMNLSHSIENIFNNIYYENIYITNNQYLLIVFFTKLNTIFYDSPPDFYRYSLLILLRTISSSKKNRISSFFDDFLRFLIFFLNCFVYTR